MRLTFHGAVRTVTGSLHQVEVGGALLYLDCGLYQGRRAEAQERNRHLPSVPRDVKAVILSHAHLDHCGNLPTLVAGGFRGPIYCTSATRDLAAVVLRDSARVARADLRIVNKIRQRQGLPAVEVLYDEHAAERAIAQMVPVGYGQRVRVGSAVATLFDAGHILGSAMVVLEGDRRRLGFTGDLGRTGSPIVRDPEVLPHVDLLLIESTYGDRQHGPLAEAETQLAAIITETIRGGGRVLIPAFALGRTQQIIYSLFRHREAGRIPAVPLYVDSPMAIDATTVYRRHPEAFDPADRARLKGRDPLGFKGARYVRGAGQSHVLVESDEPCVVIAGSGMAEGGRILHHLRRRIGDPRSTVLFVGYQAEHTLGRRLVDGAQEVRIYGEPHPVAIQVARIDAFSAHADRNELLAWARRVPDVGRAFCVHGDEAPATALAQALSEVRVKASVPTVGQSEAV